MNDTEVLSQVIQAVQTVCARRAASVEEVAASTSIMDDLGFDSLALVDLGLELELRLGCRRVSLHDWIDAEVRSGRSRTCTVKSLAKHVARRGSMR